MLSKSNFSIQLDVIQGLTSAVS